MTTSATTTAGRRRRGGAASLAFVRSQVVRAGSSATSASRQSARREARRAARGGSDGSSRARAQHPSSGGILSSATSRSCELLLGRRRSPRSLLQGTKRARAYPRFPADLWQWLAVVTPHAGASLPRSDPPRGLSGGPVAVNPVQSSRARHRARRRATEYDGDSGLARERSVSGPRVRPGRTDAAAPSAPVPAGRADSDREGSPGGVAPSSLPRARTGSSTRRGRVPRRWRGTRSADAAGRIAHRGDDAPSDRTGSWTYARPHHEWLPLLRRLDAPRQA